MMLYVFQNLFLRTIFRNKNQIGLNISYVYLVKNNQFWTKMSFSMSCIYGFIFAIKQRHFYKKKQKIDRRSNFKN